MKTKKQMIDFLTSHFRYNTMNSWNNSTSWAANVKIHRVIPSDLQDKAFELTQTTDFYDIINSILSDYSYENNHYLQAGFNGRSSGYIVMYEGDGKRCYPGRQIDNYDCEDYKQMTASDIKAIYDKVRDFDKMIKRVINETIYLCKNSEVVEVEYFECKTMKVIA